MIDLRAVLIACGTGDRTGTMQVPAEFGRVLLVHIDADLRVGLAVRRVLRESDALEVLGLILMERIGVEMAPLGQCPHRLRDLHHLVHRHVRERTVHHRRRHVFEVHVLGIGVERLIDAVEHEFGGVVTGQHLTVVKSDVAIDAYHLLDEQRIDGDDAVNIARIFRPLPHGIEHLCRTGKIRHGEQITYIERKRQRPAEYIVLLDRSTLA